MVKDGAVEVLTTMGIKSITFLAKGELFSMLTNYLKILSHPSHNGKVT